MYAGAVLVLIALVFAFMNREATTVNLIVVNGLQIPTFLLILICVALGFFIGAFLTHLRK